MQGRATDSLLLDPALQASGQNSHGHQQNFQKTSPPFAEQPQQQQPETTIPEEEDILTDYDIAVQRAQTWTTMDRFGFNAMLESPEYKNKLRLKPDKMDRIIHFLTVPEAKSRERDRADAQAKHQAQNWIYHNGVLYRKETRLQHPRRHVGSHEVFDILTAEHLKSGHHGRDKMLKVLEAKYIGYTKDELMFVLDHCLTCHSKHIRGAAARRKELKQGNV